MNHTITIDDLLTTGNGSVESFDPNVNSLHEVSLAVGEKFCVPCYIDDDDDFFGNFLNFCSNEVNEMLKRSSVEYDGSGTPLEDRFFRLYLSNMYGGSLMYLSSANMWVPESDLHNIFSFFVFDDEESMSSFVLRFS